MHIIANEGAHNSREILYWLPKSGDNWQKKWAVQVIHTRGDKTNKLQLGDKFYYICNAHGNDGWLRLFWTCSKIIMEASNAAGGMYAQGKLFCLIKNEGKYIRY
jgi:hypothetical protein